MRKKVLILTYYWPPAGGPGVQRPLYFAKYLMDFGWEPIIYTVENGEYSNLDTSFEPEIPEGIKILKTPSREPYYWYKLLTGRKKTENLKPSMVTEKTGRPLLHQMAVWIRGNFFIPDARSWWIRPSVRFLVQYLKEHPVDIIFSTSPPQSIHLIARNVKAKTGIPWIADFRDPWTGVHYFNDLKLSGRAIKKHRILEKSVLEKADKVTTVTWTLATGLKKIANRNIQVITNGFDIPDARVEAEKQKNNTLQMLYIGSLSRKRNPAKFWEHLKSWIVNSKIRPDQLEFIFIGNIDPSVFQDLDKLGLQEYYQRKDYVPHSEVWTHLKKADILFLIGIPHNPDILTGKVFEYLAAEKPIFSISPEMGDIERLVNETGAGLNADFDQPDLLLQNLQKMYQLYQNQELENSFRVKKEILNQYSRRNLTSQLAELFNELSGPKKEIN